MPPTHSTSAGKSGVATSHAHSCRSWRAHGDGEITAESFFEAASNTSNLDLNGMVPTLDFTQEWTDGLEGYQRLFNRSVVFSQLENGKVVPLTTDFEDVGALATGDAG